MRFITGSVFIISLVLYSSVYVSPEFFRFAGLFPFLIPFAYLANIILVGILGLSLRKLTLLPLIALVIGFKFAEITFQFNPLNEDAAGLKVLTYNDHLFNYHTSKDRSSEPNVFSWLRDHPADIKVFQEFYQDYGTSSRNAVKMLGKDKGYNHFFHPTPRNKTKKSIGLAIFSKYPIIHEGRVFGDNGSNGAIFADIAINHDTIRIYNTHLESMSIDSDKLENMEGVKRNYRQTLRKLNRGSLARSKQLALLTEHVKNSPHRVILLGDLNEIPYSYAYFKLSKSLVNAFEKAGRGFGFTYNKVLLFLRIDHIFSDPSLKAIQFKTHREVDYSDHYPVSATFSWDGIGK
jgi:endonuclease/exonuclease/phosphatase family metal-dependent hydrolase